MEAYRSLVALPVFKTVVTEDLGQVGSIPIRLRHHRRHHPRRQHQIPHAGPEPLVCVAYDERVESSDERRHVPRTDVVMADERVLQAGRELSMSTVKAAVRAAQARVRSGELTASDIVDEVLAALPERATTLRPVLNATGVVLHTNIGRAPLSAAAVQAVLAAAGYVDVEYDLDTGQRARRGRGALAALGEAVPAAEAALIVNNGAAALVLATTALAAGRDVVVSRGEMVEIGDGFRLPELIASTGARLREVGTTNRTSARDYEAAVTPQTGCILKVHPSNFRVEGFTSSASTAELAQLGVPVVVDIGSGLLQPDCLLPDEPNATFALAAGASVVTCSADKVLGGPQAGLILGQATVVETLRRHPLARALRVDKLTLAALEATIRGPGTPTHHYLHADIGQLKERAERLAAPFSANVVRSVGVVGGGGAPGLELPGWAASFPAPWAAALRRGNPAVIARIEHDHCLVDLRCIPESSDADVLAALLRVRSGRRVQGPAPVS